MHLNLGLWLVKTVNAIMDIMKMLFAYNVLVFAKPVKANLIIVWVVIVSYIDICLIISVNALMAFLIMDR